ncbi:MAG: dUTP diphosphatase [Campylobacterales bacterium]|nr:dUTP diphosphatase [Campylobacterales bacterium]
MSKIATMLHLQQQLNDATNGKEWEEGVTAQGKIIDWRRCIYLECAELIESYPWKHWKNISAPADTENIKIEVVDIWHFVMSEVLRLNKNSEIEEIAANIKSLENFCAIEKEIEEIGENHFEQIATIEDFIKSVFNEASWEDLVEKYIGILAQSGLNLDSLYNLYIGKNILNQFRQDYGYKDGTYKKIWNGVEDNVVMQEILNTNPDITPYELYDTLKEQYEALD